MNVPRGRATAADGVLLVDKPGGLTSHDVVARVRRLAATRKVGHAGTLDPMATGLLVLGIGRATRLLTYVVGADKTYEATVRLGVATTTDDAEGEATTSAGARRGDLAERLPAALAGLTGAIEQVPSAVSAIKVDGRRSYARVRDGEDVTLAARPVTVHELTALSDPADAVVGEGEPGAGTAVVDLDVRVRCSSGTYVRAIARDLGETLDVGGHLTALRRSAVGPFDVGQGRALDALADEVGGEGDGVLSTLPAADLARRLFPVRELTEAEARALGYGQRIDADPAHEGADVVAALAPDGHLVALVTADTSVPGRTRPLLVLAPS